MDITVIDKKCREFAAEKLLPKRDFIRSHRIFSMEEELPECDNAPITKEQFMDYMSIKNTARLLDKIKVKGDVEVPDEIVQILYNTDEKLFYKDISILVDLENEEPVDVVVYQTLIDKDNDLVSNMCIPINYNLEEV